MGRRRISWQDVSLVLQLGDHVRGREEGTREACTVLDGRPATVIYDSETFEARATGYIVTVVRRRYT